MNNTILKEINQKQVIANSTKSYWNDYIVKNKQAIHFVSIKKDSYPYWEKRRNSAVNESFLYRALITDINNKNVTIAIENCDEDQQEIYLLERKMFNFGIEINDMIDLIIENTPGQSLIKVQKYIKNQDIKDEENKLIFDILADTEDEDDF